MVLLCFRSFSRGRHIGCAIPAGMEEVVMVRRIVVFLYVIGFLAVTGVALAQEFSADVVTNKQGNQAPGKLYATRNKARWELQDRDPRMGSVALILDEAQGKSIVVMQDK